MPHVATGVITDTGTKGLLRWIQQAMPDFYDQLSPQLIAQQRTKNATISGLGCAVPSSKLVAIYGGNYADRNPGIAGLGDYYNYESSAIPTTTISPVDTLDESAITTDLNIQPASNPVSAANVASTGATSASTAQTITALANAVSTGTLAAAQVSANNTLLQTNLLRAQQGLPPLTATTTASGMISVGSSSTIMILGIAAIAAFALMGKKSA